MNDQLLSQLSQFKRKITQVKKDAADLCHKAHGESGYAVALAHDVYEAIRKASCALDVLERELSD